MLLIRSTIVQRAICRLMRLRRLLLCWQLMSSITGHSLGIHKAAMTRRPIVTIFVTLCARPAYWFCLITFNVSLPAC